MYRLVVVSSDATSDENITELYIPLYINWKKLDQIPILPLFTFILELEVVVLMLSAAVNSVLAVKVFHTRLIHKNLRIIYFGHLLEYYAFFFAQLLLMCYQVGWIWIGFDSSDDYLLIVCGVVKLQRLWSACAIIPAAVIERTWASYYIDTYEQSKNTCLAYIIIILKFLLSMCMSIQILFIRIDYWEITLSALSMIGVSLAWLLLLNWRTNVTLRRLETINHRSYSLSKRYQLMENVRVFKIIRTFVYSVVFNIITVWVVLTISTRLIPTSTFQPYIVLLMEYMIAGTPIMVAIALQLVSNKIKTADRSELARVPSRYGNSRRDDEQDTTIYFSTLEKMWS